MIYNLLAADTCPSGAAVLDVLVHGTVNSSNMARYGSVVVYECEEGYQIEGAPRTYCQGKTWKHGDVSPICIGKNILHYSGATMW